MGFQIQEFLVLAAFAVGGIAAWMALAMNSGPTGRPARTGLAVVAVLACLGLIAGGLVVFVDALLLANIGYWWIYGGNTLLRWIFVRAKRRR